MVRFTFRPLQPQRRSPRYTLDTRTRGTQSRSSNGDNPLGIKRSFSGRSVRMLSYPAHQLNCQRLTTKMLSFPSLSSLAVLEMNGRFPNILRIILLFTVICQQNLYLCCGGTQKPKIIYVVINFKIAVQLHRITCKNVSISVTGNNKSSVW